MTAAGTQSAESLESLESLEPRRFGFREGLPLWRDALRRRLLAAADVAGGVAALLLIGWFAGTRSLAWGLLVLPLCVLLAKLHGLYDRDHRALRHLTVDELPGIIAWSLSCIAVVALLATTGEIASLTAGQWIASWLALVLVAAVGRSLARAIWRHVTEPETTMLVGSGAVAQFMQRKLELFDDIHVRVDRRLPSCRHLVEDASDWCHGVDRVIVASDTVDEEALSKLIETCRKERIKLSMVPPPRRMFSAAVHLNHVADLPLIEYTTWTMSRSTLLLKRTLDLAVSLCMLVLTAPCLALIGLAIRLDSRGPVFFVQTRAGVDGRPFRMVKFRTMIADAEARLGEVVELDSLEAPMFKLQRDPRVTRVGRILRRTSLDEIPQLFNVLKGDMSAVGPRPEQADLVERYADEHRFRLSVKPGLTGPMQVFGRGALTFEERLAVERDYIDNLSLARDLRILAMTIAPVLTGRGAF